MTGGDRHGLFGAAPPDCWPVLGATALLLIERALPKNHPWRHQALKDFEALCGDLAKVETLSADTLDRVVETLAANRIKSDAPLAMFLAARVQDEEDRRTGNMLSAWVFAAALRRMRVTPEQNAIWQGLNAVRLLKTKAPQELRRLSPPFIEPAALLAQLDAAKETGATPTVRGYFRAAAALMRTAMTRGPAIHRARDATSASPTRGRLTPLGSDAMFDGVMRISGGFELESAGLAGPIALQQADRIAPVTTLQDEGDGLTVAPRKHAQARLRKVARAAARRELSLSAEVDPLTRHEAATLVDWLDANRDDPAHGPLMADLAFGAAVAGGAWTTQGGLLGLTLTVDLPDFEPLVDDASIAGGEERLFLPAPPMTGASSFDDRAGEAVGAALKRMRDRLARPLTRGRIARFKADWLRRAGADAAIIGFLIGQSPGNRAQMHYSCVARETLVAWHRRYLEHGLGLKLPHWPAPGGLYGSRLRLPKALLHAVFQEARRDIRHHRLHGLGGFAQVADAHNAFMIYTLMVLYLGSGHRPVSHPFEYRGDFDLEAGVLWISDKTGRGARGARLIPLPPFAVAQTQAWITHLERLRDRLRLTHPDLAEGPVDAALTLDAGRRGPFFLRLDPGGHIEPLRPSIQEEAVRPVLPAALNWTRHILRSALLETCDPAALDAFLGHGHVGEDPFVAGGGLRFADLFPIAQKIQTLMATLSARPVESPL